MKYQQDEMLFYAEFLVWTEEVGNGHIVYEDADEIISGYWDMYWMPEPGRFDTWGAEKKIHTSPALYMHYLNWRDSLDKAHEV